MVVVGHGLSVGFFTPLSGITKGMEVMVGVDDRPTSASGYQ